MKYKDSQGNWVSIALPSLDSMPVGTIVDYDGDTIPTGWEEANDYSTTEINTGKKWIDGKPIYRKVLSYTGNITNQLKVNHNISNLDKVINWYGYYITSGEVQCTLPYIYNSVAYQIGINYFSNTQFEWVVGNSNSVSNRPIVLVFEYTKTS